MATMRSIPSPFAPDSNELAFGCGNELRIDDMPAKEHQLFTATDDEVFAVDYSADGAQIVFGDRQGNVTLCDRVSGRSLSMIVRAHPPHVYDVEISPDGRLLATCGADASIKLWRVQEDGLHERSILRGHMGYVVSLAFSSDGTRLVSTCGDETLKVWDTQRAAEVATLYGHRHMVTTVAFAMDGTIYSAGTDRELHFWPAPPLDQFDSLVVGMPADSRLKRRGLLDARTPGQSR
jgi:hypothetical protein